MPFSARRCCIAVAVSLALAALPALAQEQATQYELNLPEQPLADSLRDLGKAAHVNIVFDPAAVAGRRAPVLNGRYATDEALARLLAGSGLNLRETAGGSYAVGVPQAQSAAPADAGVSASTGEQAQNLDGVYTFDPLRVYGKVEGFSATRMPTLLKDIPQSVSVIDQQTLREQNANDLSKALTWATGITVLQAGPNNDFTSRGFSINTLHIDGGGPLTLSIVGNHLQRTDLSQYESIELLRGADALFGGTGSPGGSINLTRKRPKAEASTGLTASAGSWDNYRVEADINTGSITDSGRLRARMVAVTESEHYFFDTAKRNMNRLYAIGEYDLRPNTQVRLGGSIERTPDYVPFASGLPRYSDGSDPRLPRSTALAFPWVKNNSTRKEGFVRLEHSFNERWHLKAGATRTEQDQSLKSAQVATGINPRTRTIASGTSASGSFAAQQTAMDITLAGSFDWNGRIQEVVFGVVSQRKEYALDQANRAMPSINPFRFDPSTFPEPTRVTSRLVLTDSSREHGVFASLRLRPADGWALTAGARSTFSRSHSEQLLQFGSFLQNQPSVADTSSSGVITPFFGAVYEINPTYSLYASYADVSEGYSSSLMTVSGEILNPARGTNQELGLKAAWGEGRLNGSLALFDIEKVDVPVTDPATPIGAPLGCCYMSTTQRSKGFEVELNGRLAPGWQLSAGYTLDINRAGNDQAMSTTPKHLFKLWTSYRLPGRGEAWDIGGGVIAQTKNYRMSSACPAFDLTTGRCTGPFVPYRVEQGFYSVTSLRAGYRVNERWNLALNVDNLFDRRYFQTIGRTGGGNWYGAPRNWMLTLRGEF